MKFTEALAERKLKISDLPKSQQKKIFDLLKLDEKLEKIKEEDVEEEEKEKIASFRSQVQEADAELVSFISSFDLVKANEQRERLAKMRENNRNKEKLLGSPQQQTGGYQQQQPAPAAPAVEPTSLSGTSGTISIGASESVSVSVTEEAAKAASVQEPKPQPQPEAKIVPLPPVREGEQTIEKHIEQLKREAEIKPDSYEQPQMQEEHQEVHHEPIFVEAEEEFEKKGERKPRKINIPLVVMGVGALILTWGAVNFFKERK